jgi:hypothetical protein
VVGLFARLLPPADREWPAAADSRFLSRASAALTIKPRPAPFLHLSGVIYGKVSAGRPTN